MADLQSVTPGQPFKPKASDWNAFVDTTRHVNEGRVIFGVPRLEGGGSGSELLPYIVTQLNEDGENTYVHRRSHPSFKAKPALGSGGLFTLGTEEVDIFVGTMNGVAFTGDVILVTQIGGRRYCVSSHRETFVGVPADVIAAEDEGDVLVTYTDYREDTQTPQTVLLPCLNTLDRGLSNGSVMVTFTIQQFAKFMIWAAMCDGVLT